MLKTYKCNEGKGNYGKFMERNPRIYAAGVTSSQSKASVEDSLRHYLLKEEVDALIGDTIKPPKIPVKLPPLRRPLQKDMRNAGPFTEAADLINPPVKTKFQILVDDFKDTAYSSYFKKSLGKVSDPVRALPAGFDILTCLGNKVPPSERLYDVVMPIEPIFDKAPKSLHPGYQTDRNYCRPSYNSSKAFGKRPNVGSSSTVKGCLTYENIFQGTNLKIPLNTKQGNQNKNRPLLGVATTPNNNINNVPEGFSFGKPIQYSDNVMECMVTCDINPKKELIKQCLAHLNSVRKYLGKRFDSSFFPKFYLTLRYCDKSKTGWLSKTLVYKYCADKYIRINASLLEPLLHLWNAFDGSLIEYKTFVNVINFTQVIPNLPKVCDILQDCIDFRTTYTEMVKRNQEVGKVERAGLPSGRYIDMDFPVTPKGYCKADRAYLPQESDAMACLCPSLFTILGLSHRDMYDKREPETVKRVFELAGEKFDDDKFISIWNKASKYHSQGWVSFETFRRAINDLKCEENRIVT